jgi:8-oxo-dGTP diphosphatase
MAAGALITNGNSVLIVKPSYKHELEIPGGIIEFDDSPRSALTRELKEELGLELKPGRLLVIEYQSGNDHKTESIMF